MDFNGKIIRGPLPGARSGDRGLGKRSAILTDQHNHLQLTFLSAQRQDQTDHRNGGCRLLAGQHGRSDTHRQGP